MSCHADVSHLRGDQAAPQSCVRHLHVLLARVSAFPPLEGLELAVT